MLAIAEVMRAASLVVRWAMVPPMVQPMGISPMTMVWRFMMLGWDLVMWLARIALCMALPQTMLAKPMMKRMRSVVARLGEYAKAMLPAAHIRLVSAEVDDGCGGRSDR